MGKKYIKNTKNQYVSHRLMENLQDKYSLVLALKIAYSSFCLGKILCLNLWSLEVAGLLSTGHRISEVARYYGRV